MSCSSSSRAVIPFLVLWLVDTDSQAYIPIETHTIKKIKISLQKIKEVDRFRGVIPAAELCFDTKVYERMHSYTLLKGHIHIITMYSRKKTFKYIIHEVGS